MPEDAHEIDGLPAELRLLPRREAHHLRVQLELAEAQVLAVERAAGQPAGIGELPSAGVQRRATSSQPPSASGRTS